MHNMRINKYENKVPMASAHQTDFVISLPRSKTALHHMIWQLKKQIEDLRAEQDLQTTQRSAWIDVKVNRRYERIQIGDIIRCQADGSYTQLHLKDRTRRLITGTLKQIEKKMSAHHFIRCHQSHLVNTTYIAKLDVDNNKLELIDKIGIPVSRSKRASVRKLFYPFN